VRRGVYLRGFLHEGRKQSLKLRYGQTRHAEKSAGAFFKPA
jgi:hypothetical protein